MATKKRRKTTTIQGSYALIRLYRYTMILRHDVDFPALCPLRQIIALAIADRALEGVESPGDLIAKYRPVGGQPFNVVPMRECMREVPLFRPCREATGVDGKKIWSYHYLHGLLKDLGKRAGYSASLLPYSFRRGHGSVLDSTSAFPPKFQR